MSRKRQRALKFVVLGAAVAALTFVALWRVAAPRATGVPAGPAQRPDTAGGTPQPLGRPIVLEAADITEIPSARTLWVRDAVGGMRFVVLDPDVKRTGEPALQPGARVTVVGLVRALPRPETAARQWSIDEAMLARLAGQDYVYATEIRSPTQ